MREVGHKGVGCSRGGDCNQRNENAGTRETGHLEHVLFQDAMIRIWLANEGDGYFSSQHATNNERMYG